MAQHGAERPAVRADPCPARAASTVSGMSTNHETRAQIVATPFVASWIGHAREGTLLDADPTRRRQAWASWVLAHVADFAGYQDRSYRGIVLPGRFYDPKGSGPSIRPHLEIPERTFANPDRDFPDRLAQFGNGLLFPWWVPAEVTAAKRALFTHPGTRVDGVVNLLNEQRPAIVDAAKRINETLMPVWPHIESVLVSNPEEITEVAVADIAEHEVVDVFPAAASMHLSLRYDTRLREKSGLWASRRLGVWQLNGVNDEGDTFSLGTVTPRLTAGSLFRDDLFQPGDEAVAALLARCLILSRLVRAYSETAKISIEAVNTAPEELAARLRAVPARPGQKLPEASLKAAAGFLQAFTDEQQAFAALEGWAERNTYLLTVTSDGFAAAWRRAHRFLRRAEELDRDDINVLLPLVLDENQRVVRTTFTTS